MFEKILVPLDGSQRAEQALRVAARIAHASGGSIHLMQVLSLAVGYDGGMAPISFVTEQSAAIELDQSTSYLKSVAALPVLAGIHTTHEVMFGLPAQYILATAESREVDLIVMCSHGRTGFARWALGSVAHTLAHESTVPMLVLRDNEPASLLPDTNKPLCALVPLDGSAFAEASLIPAAQLVAALAGPTQGALHLTQIIKSTPTAEEGFGTIESEVDAKATQHARAYLAQVTEKLQTTLKDLKLTYTSSVKMEKDVSDALLHEAEHENAEKATFSGCNLIAISTHGRGGLERWVMGSVTQRLLTSTKLPMLIVRPPKKSPSSESSVHLEPSHATPLVGR